MGPVALERLAKPGANRMPQLVLRVGSRSAQGVRPNNEDSFVVDLRQRLFVVADGMGGQDRGEVASSMAVELVPQFVRVRLALQDSPEDALRFAIRETNEAIVEAGSEQPEGRRMGTTVVVALMHDDSVYITNLGDSRAYLIRGYDVYQLTTDHSVAQALVTSGALSREEAKLSPYQHVLHKFLGCEELATAAEVYPFVPQPGDRLLLATDGMTNHITEDELRCTPSQFPDPQDWVNHLVDKALAHGSRDNVTAIGIAFDASN